MVPRNNTVRAGRYFFYFRPLLFPSTRNRTGPLDHRYGWNERRGVVRAVAARRSGSGAQQRTRRGENPGGDSSRRGARSARRLPSSAAQVRRGGAGRRCLPWARCGASSELGRAVSAAACSSRAVWLLSARSVCRNAAAAQSVRATRRAALGSQARCGAVLCVLCAD